MSNQNFVPMFDLDRLNDEQLRQYYLDACQFHGVPPELNVLAFTLMDSGDGARRRVLYAKKGATDIIRERLGISVVDLRKEVFNGTLTYTCLGKNAAGRTEIAVGASYIDGVIGRALEIAIMVAQTRAVRRMTLQFAGAGLLDETELQADSKTTDIKDVLSTPQPIARPNSAPGKDITQNPPIEGVSLQEISPTPAPGKRISDYLPVLKEIIAKTTFSDDGSFNMPTPAQLEAQAALIKVPLAVLAKEAGESVPEAPKRRSRPKPVELDTPFSFDNPATLLPTKTLEAVADTFGSGHKMSPNVNIPESKRTATVAEVLLRPLPPMELPSIMPPLTLERLDAAATEIGTRAAEFMTAKQPILVLPAEAALKALRDKLFKYTSEILPQAGMVPTENVGGIGMKVRLYVQAKYQQVLNQLSVDQWEDMFKLFDSLSPAELVQLIDETAIKAKTT